MVFQPSLSQDSADSLYRLIESVLEDIFNCGTLVPRVAKHKDIPDYHSDVEEVCLPNILLHDLSRIKYAFNFLDICFTDRRAIGNA